MGLKTSFHRLSQMVGLGLVFTVVWLGLVFAIKLCVVLERLACPRAFTRQIRRI